MTPKGSARSPATPVEEWATGIFRRPGPLSACPSPAAAAAQPPGYDGYGGSQGPPPVISPGYGGRQTGTPSGGRTYHPEPDPPSSRRRQGGGGGGSAGLFFLGLSALLIVGRIALERKKRP